MEITFVLFVCKLLKAIEERSFEYNILKSYHKSNKENTKHATKIFDCTSTVVPT